MFEADWPGTVDPPNPTEAPDLEQVSVDFSDKIDDESQRLSDIALLDLDEVDIFRWLLTDRGKDRKFVITRFTEDRYRVNWVTLVNPTPVPVGEPLFQFTQTSSQPLSLEAIRQHYTTHQHPLSDEATLAIDAELKKLVVDPAGDRVYILEGVDNGADREVWSVFQARYMIQVSAAQINQIKQRLRGKRPGDVIVARALVNDPATLGFAQTLSFPLRLADEITPRLPLQPRFIHFEDPEYNRRLISSAAHATKTELVDKSVLTVKLSADRREYNPDSELALRYDWVGEGPENVRGYVILQKLDLNGIVTDLQVVSENKTLNPCFLPGELRQFSLLDLGKMPPDNLSVPSPCEDVDPASCSGKMRRFRLRQSEHL